ncbi:MAG: helix-turn-helix domain-containing protein, partial [Parvularculaceae bacterium]
MAAPHQNIADILVLQTRADETDFLAPASDMPDAEPDPENDAPVGLKLATARKAKGLTHLDVHAGTKIKIVHIVAIEAGERAFLPATPFTAGFVKAYAQFLGLSGDEFARAYKREAGFVPPSAQLPTPVPALATRAELAEAPVQAVATQAAAAPSSQYGPVYQSAAAPSRQTIDADKTVTWIGAGAAIAIAAFLAGRAAQPREAAL